MRTRREPTAAGPASAGPLVVSGRSAGAPSAESVPVYRITDARRGLADEQRTRVRGYVISMSLRIAFFALAVVTTGWVRWLAVAAAIGIPYLAVVYANGGREPVQDPPETLLGDGRAQGHELPAPPLRD